MRDEEVKTVPVAEAMKILGHGVTPANVHGRIRRGSLEAYKNEQGEWRIPLADLKRILDDVEVCGSCPHLATSFVIIKYHHHNRIEFTLCADCAAKAQLAYSRQGGVLEIVAFPLLGEGWKKP
jgi:hypothetical protein